MPDKKLTDNEIIKALKELLEIMCCEGDLQRAATISNTIDLINRLQARVKKCEKVENFADKTIAALQTENKRLIETIDSFTDIGKLYSEIKAEAYKEFEKLLMSYYAEFDEVNEIITISNLEKAVKDSLKELAGDIDV